MGMVPNLVTGVWVGGDDRATRFKSITYGQGAAMALPIWGLYMKENYKNEDLGISKEAFEKPEDLEIQIDCSKPIDGDLFDTTGDTEGTGEGLEPQEDLDF